MRRAKSAQHRGPAPAVSASELAQMGVCERRVLFEHRHGWRRTRAQAAAIERGRLAHLRFFHKGAWDAASGAISLNANPAFGTRVKAMRARHRRERGRRRQPLGRWMTSICDRWAAAICAWLTGRPGGQRAGRAVRRLFIRYATRWRAGRGHD